MRGERNRNNIIFKCKDIAKLFELDRLCIDILKESSACEYSIDMLYCKTSQNSQNTDKELYLTFSGLQKVIRNSRTGRAKDFIDWLDEIIFAVMFGTDEQRVKASANVMNIELEALKKLMNKCAYPISCLYVLKTGKKDKVSGDDIYKYGFSKDLNRRFKEHSNIFGNELEIISYCFISEDKLKNAEQDFKDSTDCFKGTMHWDDTLKTQEELLFLSYNKLKNIKQIIQTIGSKYSSDNKLVLEHLTEEINKYKMQLFSKEEEIKHLKEIMHLNSLKDKEEIKHLEEINKLKDEKIAMIEQSRIENKELYEAKLELYKLKNNL